jgi:hypothetical protein
VLQDLQDEQLDHFGKQKYEHGGRLNVEIRVFMEAAQEPLCLNKPSVLHHGFRYQLYFNHYFV